MTLLKDKQEQCPVNKLLCVLFFFIIIIMIFLFLFLFFLEALFFLDVCVRTNTCSSLISEV